MHETSALYRSIISGNYSTEVKLVVDGMEEGTETEYGMDVLKSVSTSRSALGDGKPTLGLAVSGDIDVTMFTDGFVAPRMARMQLFCRVKSEASQSMDNFILGGILYTDATIGANDILVFGSNASVSNSIVYFSATVHDAAVSEWIPKGVYFIDTRELQDGFVSIHGYDAMLKAEQPFPSNTLGWPAADTDVVSLIAETMGVDIDERTVMTQGFPIQLPEQYVTDDGSEMGDVFTMRDTLAGIAGLYGGAWIMNDYGKLQLLLPWDAPAESFYLLTENGDYITVGGNRILLRRDASA